jgi:hypothetical protein
MEEETTVAEIEEQTESFQDLIRGKYREDYLKALSEALCAQARETDRYLAYRDLMTRAEAVKTGYPEFDLDRELEDPQFARLLNNGVDPKTAYEVVHHEELTGRAARLAENAARPQENGLGRGSLAAVTKPDPKSLTRAERKLLRRRAARGEEIIW